MKIAINGNVVDTESIYAIDKIISGYWESDENSNWFVEKSEDPTVCNTHMFRVKFLTGDTLKIEDKDLNKIVEFRTRIIRAWIKAQIEIPEFNLE